MVLTSSYLLLLIFQPIYYAIAKDYEMLAAKALFLCSDLILFYHSFARSSAEL